MKISDLDFDYPEDLVATAPQHPCRVMWVEQGVSSEIGLNDLLERIPAGDVLVINNTKVLKRRVFAADDLEILFLNQKSDLEWEVLFPSRKFSVGDQIQLPQGLTAQLMAKGRPQMIKLSQAVSEEYFIQNAELPLPPYIQKSRGQRHSLDQDENWYQTAWAKNAGSLAAPTASLHFSNQDLQSLQKRGVILAEITLHVGLGTFLPVTSEDLDQHEMHSEWIEIPFASWKELVRARIYGRKIWALGTTVARSLESLPLGYLKKNQAGDFAGESNLLIQPGHNWQMVDCLLTNFHQPQSTLLALVASFTGLSGVQKAYRWAIERKFKLFSYGDLSVWIR